MNEKVILSECVQKVFESPNNESFKFGYYNYSPISADGSKLLAHRIPFEGRAPNSDDKVEIGFFQLPAGNWNKIAETRAFNWQQGAMLQWLGPDFNNRVIFNDASETNYIARIIDLRNLSESVIPKAVYGVHPSGKFSISLNFERFQFTRSYSYTSIIDESWNEFKPLKDGIIRIDLESGQSETIITLEEIVDHCEDRSSDIAHWFEHIWMNPSGNRFSFCHRYGSQVGFKTQVYTADLDGKNIWRHSSSELERTTHLGWRSDGEYVLFTIPKSKLNQAWVGQKGRQGKGKWYIELYRKVLKPFVPRSIVKKLPKPNAFYALTQDSKGIVEHITIKPENMDGHPSYTADGRYMLTDTYADTEGYRHLLIYDQNLRKTFPVGKFYSSFNNVQWRADLHPRFSPDEQYIIVDSSHNGHHQMVVLKVNWEQLLTK